MKRIQLPSRGSFAVHISRFTLYVKFQMRLRHGSKVRVCLQISSTFLFLAWNSSFLNQQRVVGTDFVGLNDNKHNVACHHKYDILKAVLSFQQMFAEKVLAILLASRNDVWKGQRKATIISCPESVGADGISLLWLTDTLHSTRHREGSGFSQRHHWVWTTTTWPLQVSFHHVAPTS